MQAELCGELLARGEISGRAAKHLFAYSILYLLVLFSALMAESLSGAFARTAT